MIDSLRLAIGWASQIIGCELALAALMAALLLDWRRHAGAPKRELLLWTAVLLLLGLLAVSQFFSSGKPIFACGLLMPGSLLTRWFTPDLHPLLRRLLEPSLLLLFVLLLELRTLVAARLDRRLFSLTIFLLLLLYTVELLLFSPDFRGELLARSLTRIALLIHYGLTQLFLLTFLCSLGSLLRQRKPIVHDLCGKSQLKILVFGCLLVAFLGVETKSVVGLLSQDRQPIVGVHYYSWFPENWVAGFVGERMIPPILPVLGKYNSAEPAVFQQHLSWAAEAGVNLLIFDWWSKRPSVRKRIQQEVEMLQHEEDPSFAVMYETLDLKDPRDATIPEEDDNVVYFTEARAGRMAAHWEHLAKNFMMNPHYLRIQGKPVLFVYATRHTIGPVREAVEAARQRVREATGLELYLIADEAYFHVLNYSRAKGVYLMANLQPNWERLSVFDAVTCYNAYDAARPEHGGDSGAKRYLEDVSELYRRYRNAAAAAGVDFIPGALPGYNDRGVRLKENHFILPRLFRSSEGEQSFFSENLRLLVEPNISEEQPFFTVTSWNEWNEETQIEPNAAAAPPSDQARASLKPQDAEVDSTADYTMGENYSAYGDRYLRELALFVKNLRR